MGLLWNWFTKANRAWNVDAVDLLVPSKTRHKFAFCEAKSSTSFSFVIFFTGSEIANSMTDLWQSRWHTVSGRKCTKKKKVLLKLFDRSSGYGMKMAPWNLQNYHNLRQIYSAVIEFDDGRNEKLKRLNLHTEYFFEGIPIFWLFPS